MLDAKRLSGRSARRPRSRSGADRPGRQRHETWPTASGRSTRSTPGSGCSELGQHTAGTVTLAHRARRRSGTPSPRSASTPSGSWASGSAARPGSRSPCENQGLLDDFRRALPDFAAADNVGSPYCVRRYVVDAHLGGPAGLAAAREELARRGLAPDARLRAQPRRARPSVGHRASRLLHPGQLRRTSQRDPRLVPRGRAIASSPAAATRTSRPGPTCCS